MKRAIAFALCSALLLGACGGDSAGDDPSDAESPLTEETGSDTESSEAEGTENVVPVDMTEYEFGMPDSITGGVVTFEATNVGGLPHEMAFGKIEGDRDLDDVMAALEGGEPPPWFSDVAGIPVLTPGVTASMTRELEEGRYVFLCFLPTPEGEPHAVEGMVKVFEVEGTSEAELPEPDLTFTATDEGFEVPEVTAGSHVVELSNEGEKTHEFALYSLEEGKTGEDIGEWFNSGFKTDPPAVFPGGIQAIEPGEPVFVEMTFESGRTYTLEDFPNKLNAEIVVE